MWSEALEQKDRDVMLHYLEMTSEMPMVILDNNHRIVECNHAFRLLLELPEKPLGVKIADYLTNGDHVSLPEPVDKEHATFQKIQLSFFTKSVPPVGFFFNYYGSAQRHYIFGDRMISQEKGILQEFTHLSNQLTNMNRELSKKNRELEASMAQQQEMAAALQQSEALLNVTQEVSKIGGWEWDVEKETMFWTREVYRIHGFNPDAISPGSTEHIERSLLCYDAEHRLVVQDALRRCIKEGISYNLEFPFTTVKGERIWIRTQGKAVWEEKKIARVIGNIMDITKRKQAELKNDDYTMELELKGIELEEEVGERIRVAKALEKAKEEAEQANALKSEFLANMSHEIRTPMNVIIGMSDLLYNSRLSSEQQDYAGMVRDSATSLLAIINDILDFSKIEAGHLTLEQVEFNLWEEMEKTVSTFSFQARDKGIALLKKVGEDVPQYLCGDPTRLRQVLVNLVGNAVKFTEQGKVSICVEKQAMETADSVLLCFAVQDTGIGIPEDKLDRLFKSFSQVDGSHTRKYGGTGLGLIISKRLVELMGGNIQVKSKEGDGTTFSFNLSLELSDKRAKPEGKPGGQKQNAVARVTMPFGLHSENVNSTVQILLAEDKPMNRKMATLLLERKGWTVTPAVNGRQALELLQSQPFDLVLMDIQMPEMDGLEATAQIRAWEAKTGYYIPIIAMTAHAMKGDRERYLEAGMDGYVSKPIDAAELYNTVTQMVDKKRTATKTDIAGEASGLLESLGGDKDLLAEMVQLFFEDAAGDLKQIGELLAKGEAENAALLVHGIKGQLGNLQFKAAYTAAIKLEKALKGNHIQEAGLHLQELDIELKIIKTYFADSKWRYQ